jgi:hypothetical protein
MADLILTTSGSQDAAGLCAWHTCTLALEEAGLLYRVKGVPFGAGMSSILRTNPSARCRG